MNRTKHLVGKLGIGLCSVLLGCTAYGQPSVSVGVTVPLPSVEIRAESDFYEPLAPEGEWVVIGSYGRCWRPGHVDRDWRPYSEGYWQRTDEGWYWVSDEPWAWATYHYGRWDYTDQYGWYWVPQIQWAPAWVSWHSGGGYIGWAPLYPSGVTILLPRAYVFVEERHFTEPVRRSTLVVNNTTIINHTTVINEGPATAQIERTSGHKVQTVAVRELRQKEEAPVVARQRTLAAAGEKKDSPPVHNEAAPGEKKAVATHESAPVERAPATTREPAAPAPKNNELQSEQHKPVPAAPELKPEARPEGNHPPAIKEPTQPPADKHVKQQQEKSVQPADKKEQPSTQENPAANGQNGSDPAGQSHGNNKGHE